MWITLSSLTPTLLLMLLVYVAVNVDADDPVDDDEVRTCHDTCVGAMLLKCIMNVHTCTCNS